MNLTLTWSGTRLHCGYATAVAHVAAALRDGHTVEISVADTATRWAITAAGDATAVNPDLFADPTAPPWATRLAADAAALNHITPTRT
ncbi:MAG: hypothetical protein ACRD0G_06215 [Acidimicrobiales bacterium]